MENKKILELIDAINHISLNAEDLMGAVLDYAKIYFKNNSSHEKIIDRLFSFGEFNELLMMSARESIVLAMNALTLDEKIDFNIILNKCINKDSHQNIINSFQLKDEDYKVLKGFIFELRKEIFSRVISKNKDLHKATLIPKEVVKKRADMFMKHEI